MGKCHTCFICWFIKFVFYILKAWEKSSAAMSMLAVQIACSASEHQSLTRDSYSQISKFLMFLILSDHFISPTRMLSDLKEHDF